MKEKRLFRKTGESVEIMLISEHVLKNDWNNDYDVRWNRY